MVQLVSVNFVEEYFMLQCQKISSKHFGVRTIEKVSHHYGVFPVY